MSEDRATFFERQEKAKLDSYWALCGFSLCVVLVVGLISLSALFTESLWQLYFYKKLVVPFYSPEWVFDSERQKMIWFFGLFSLGLILLGYFLHRLQYRKPADKMANEFGAKDISTVAASANPSIRKYQMALEEMLIAAVLPKMKAYVLPNENTINAFVVGPSFEETGLFVTQGALDRLDTDELSALIAHELSHVVHQDTLLNLELSHCVHGLYQISEFARFFMRLGRNIDSGGVGATGSRLSGRHKRNGVQFVFFIVGAVVFVIGIWGYFSALLLQGLFSRSREYLADVTSIQFTRNPLALLGVFKKIQIQSEKSFSRLFTRFEWNHLFFARHFESSGFLPKYFSSHPPLEERIARIEFDHGVLWETSTRAKHPEKFEASVAAPEPDNPLPLKTLVGVFYDPRFPGVFEIQTQSLVSQFYPDLNLFEQVKKEKSYLETSKIKNLLWALSKIKTRSQNEKTKVADLCLKIVSQDEIVTLEECLLVWIVKKELGLVEEFKRAASLTEQIDSVVRFSKHLATYLDLNAESMESLMSTFSFTEASKDLEKYRLKCIDYSLKTESKFEAQEFLSDLETMNSLSVTKKDQYLKQLEILSKNNSKSSNNEKQKLKTKNIQESLLYIFRSK